MHLAIHFRASVFNKTSCSLTPMRLRRQRSPPLFSCTVALLDPAQLTFFLSHAHIGSIRVLVVSMAATNSPHYDRNMVGPVRREDDRQNGGNNRYNPFGITSLSFPQSANAPSTPAQPEKPKLWNWLNKAMPKNGMRFPDRASVCKRIRRNRSIWFSLDCEFL